MTHCTLHTSAYVYTEVILHFYPLPSCTFIIKDTTFIFSDIVLNGILHQVLEKMLIFDEYGIIRKKNTQKEVTWILFHISLLLSKGIGLGRLPYMLGGFIDMDEKKKTEAYELMLNEQAERRKASQRERTRRYRLDQLST